MSVQLILSSKQIQLDEKHLGVLNIKATFFGTTEPTAVFYKVRTNLKELIDVRPSFGVILKNGEDDGIATMNIKYLGDLDELKRMKLQLSWVWGYFKGTPLQKLMQKKLTHDEFKEYYEALKQNMSNQKSHLLLFRTKYQTKQSQQSLIINQQAKRGHETMPEEDEFQNQKETSTKVHISHHIEETKEIKSVSKPSEKSESRGVSGKTVIILVLISLLVGVFLGYKLESLRQTIPQNFKITIKVPEIQIPSYGGDADLGDKQQLQQKGQQVDASL